MFKLKNITVTGHIVTMLVLINCQEDEAYSLTLDVSEEQFGLVETSLPDVDFCSCIGKIVSTLREYKGKELPTELTVAWY